MRWIPSRSWRHRRSVSSRRSGGWVGGREGQIRKHPSPGGLFFSSWGGVRAAVGLRRRAFVAPNPTVHRGFTSLRLVNWSKPWRIEVCGIETPLLHCNTLRMSAGRPLPDGIASALRRSNTPTAHMRRPPGLASMPHTKTDERGRRFAALNCQLQGPCPPPGRFSLPKLFAGAILALKPPDIW
jgi:hypothetical protein